MYFILPVAGAATFKKQKTFALMYPQCKDVNLASSKKGRKSVCMYTSMHMHIYIYIHTHMKIHIIYLA